VEDFPENASDLDRIEMEEYAAAMAKLAPLPEFAYVIARMYLATTARRAPADQHNIGFHNFKQGRASVMEELIEDARLDAPHLFAAVDSEVTRHVSRRRNVRSRADDRIRSDPGFEDEFGDDGDFE